MTWEEVGRAMMLLKNGKDWRYRWGDEWDGGDYETSLEMIEIMYGNLEK